jgi:hypothetical protein
VISEITGVDSLYEVPDVLWNRITPLLPHRNRNKKKKSSRPRMNDRMAINAISTSYVQAVSGMLYLEVLVLLVQCMTDFKSGERL